MSVLNDSQLEKVAGGSDREKKVTVTVDYTNDAKFTGNVTITPYLDGELLSSQEQTVDSSVTVVYIRLSGRGMASLRVKINGVLIKNYSVNFDNSSYTEVL